eukprot:2740819-Pleurochrysis_carterae.AAC.1
MYDTSGVGWAVPGVRVREPWCVGCCTRMAGTESGSAECGRCVSRHVGETSKAGVARVESTVHVLGCLLSRHGVYVGSRPRGADVECARPTGRVAARHMRWGELRMQLVKAAVASQAKGGAMS